MTVRYLLLTITALLLLVGIVSAQDLAASPPNTIRHIITPEDVLTIRELYDVKLSPDGKQIAFEVSEPNQPREPRASNIWVVPTDGREPPRPLIPGLKSADAPSWSPDGHTLAFLSDRGDEEAVADSSRQIYLWREGEKKALKFTNVPGGVDQYQWSPDGKMIAFIAYDQSTAEELAKKAVGDDAIVRPESSLKFARLWTVNLSDGKTVQVTKDDFEIVELAWSPRGDELALVVAPTPRNEDSYNLSLVIINRSTGEVTRTLTKNVVPITGVLRWSPVAG